MSMLIKRGGGTGPEKPRQPLVTSRCQIRQKLPDGMILEDESKSLTVCLSIPERHFVISNRHRTGLECIGEAR